MQLQALDHILATCGAPSTCGSTHHSARHSFDTLPRRRGHLVDYKRPLSVASTLSENLLLEYTEGMDANKVGWGCVDVQSYAPSSTCTQPRRTTRSVHVSSPSRRLQILWSTSAGQSSRLPLGSLSPAVAKSTDQMLVLVGHDTNLENIAGMLGLNWILDGRHDDTLPGSALAFELWRSRDSPAYTVKSTSPRRPRADAHLCAAHAGRATGARLCIPSRLWPPGWGVFLGRFQHDVTECCGPAEGDQVTLNEDGCVAIGHRPQKT